MYLFFPINFDLTLQICLKYVQRHKKIIILIHIISKDLFLWCLNFTVFPKTEPVIITFFNMSQVNHTITQSGFYLKLYIFFSLNLTNMWLCIKLLTNYFSGQDIDSYIIICEHCSTTNVHIQYSYNKHMTTHYHTVHQPLYLSTPSAYCFIFAKNKSSSNLSCASFACNINIVLFILAMNTNVFVYLSRASSYSLTAFLTVSSSWFCRASCTCKIYHPP